ncbi:hypothetical protein D3C84_1048690 [compost metagenome]
MQGEADARQAQARLLLDHHGAVEEVGTHAAIFFRDVRAEHAGLTGLVPQGTVDVAVLLPLGVERHGLLLEEFAHGLAELLVLVTEQGSWNHCYTCI